MKSLPRGFTIVEMLVATALTAVFITLCVQMLSATGAQRRATEKRAIALQEAANVTESLGSLPWEEITPERIAQFRLSEPAQQILGKGVLKIALEPSKDVPPAKLARVEITWPNAGGGADAAVRLSTWIFSPEKSPAP